MHSPELEFFYFYPSTHRLGQTLKPSGKLTIFNNDDFCLNRADAHELDASN